MLQCIIKLQHYPMLDKTSGQVLAFSGSGQALLEISLDRLINLLINLSRKAMYIEGFFIQLNTIQV